MLNKFNNLNALSMVSEKALHTLVNFAVLAVLARMLGPEMFGKFGLVQAVFIIGFHVALFFSEQTIIKFLLVDGVDTKELFKKIVILKYIASVPIYFISIVASTHFYGNDFGMLAAVYCCAHLVNVDKLFFTYFRALEKGFLIFVARLSVYIPMAVVKISAVVFYSDLILLAAAYVLEAIVLSVVSYYLYNTALKSIAIESDEAIDEVALMSDVEGGKQYNNGGFKQLSQAAWPIFSSALLIALYARIDQFMIESILGAKDLGVYTTAVKVSEASTYIVTTLIASRFPQLMRLSRLNADKFEQEVAYLLKVALFFSVSSFFIFLIFGEYIVSLLFGVEYVSASGPLVVLMAGTLFIYYGVICTQYLITKDLEIFRLYRVLWGLGINIVLNMFLIPQYGLMGAAFSTLFSQALSAVLFNAFSSKTRYIFLLQIKSFVFWRSRLGDK